MSSLPASLQTQKANLRAAALARRDALSSEQRAAAAQTVGSRGLPVAIVPGTIVAGYAPIRSEIDPAALMLNVAAQGMQLALPVIAARDGPLGFRAWAADDKLQRGLLGILEPSPDAAEIVPDIMLVPLAAFDRLGHRIGYGAGHYDRTLQHLRKLKRITAIGVAFAVQEIDVIPAQSHDVALDYVLTEMQVFDFRSL
jgi:5-formyltetrahydrofolate cyclo-ligase